MIEEGRRLGRKKHAHLDKSYQHFFPFRSENLGYWTTLSWMSREVEWEEHFLIRDASQPNKHPEALWSGCCSRIWTTTGKGLDKGKSLPNRAVPTCAPIQWSFSKSAHKYGNLVCTTCHSCLLSGCISTRCLWPWEDQCFLGQDTSVQMWHKMQKNPIFCLQSLERTGVRSCVLTFLLASICAALFEHLTCIQMDENTHQTMRGGASCPVKGISSVDTIWSRLAVVGNKDIMLTRLITLIIGQHLLHSGRIRGADSVRILGLKTPSATRSMFEIQPLPHISSQ